MTHSDALPELLRLYPAPWHITGDGIKNHQGIWICTARHELMHQMVELANYAASAAGALQKARKVIDQLVIATVEEGALADAENSDGEWFAEHGKEALAKIDAALACCGDSE